MTNTKAIRVPGWKTEITADGITFERADWFCVANFRDVIKRSAEYEKHGWKEDNQPYRYGALGIVGDFVSEGAPIRPWTKTWHAMVEAIADAAQMNS